MWSGSIITAVSEDGMDVALTCDSKCPAVMRMFDSLEQPIDVYEVCFVKPGNGPIYEAAEQLLHGACPVPSAFLKVIEAECKLALPKAVKMEFID